MFSSSVECVTAKNVLPTIPKAITTVMSSEAATQVCYRMCSVENVLYSSIECAP